MENHSPAEDYRCKHCGNLVLYRIDHTVECKHHPIHDRNLN